MNALDRAKEYLDQALKAGKQVILALEGPAASGKTTLAAALSESYGAPIIHMDEFFLPPALRTADRFAQPGGNIHYERFWDQVAIPLRAGIPFAYETFDCGRMAMGGEKQVSSSSLILVEGVYSLHPLYRDVYTHRIFLCCDEKVQDVRLRLRGEWLYDRFQREWLPMERVYFSVCRPRECCDLVLDTGSSLEE